MPDHHITLHRTELGRQWHCHDCPWTGTIVLWDAPPAAHAQATRAAVDHASRRHQEDDAK